MVDKLKDEIQSKALKAFVAAGSRGTMCLETGTGKSRAGTMFMHNQEDVIRVLITSPRTLLQDSWQKELIKWGFEPWRDNIWTTDYDGEKPSKRFHIEIVNIQTCYKWSGRVYDLVILDEANIALYYKLFSTEELITVLEERNPKIEVVITGRKAPEKLIEYADLVTEMKEIKHYYTQGIEARTGIEK